MRVSKAGPYSIAITDLCLILSPLKNQSLNPKSVVHHQPKYSLFKSLKNRSKSEPKKMAQRDKEETEFKVHETVTLCVNNCGFSGNPATKNMCQSCFKASTGILTTSLKFPGHEKSRSSTIRSPERSDLVTVERSPDLTHDATVSERTGTIHRKVVNRCSGCQRKVGLTGFRCRCGDLFCSEHRYSDRHDCSFDYKAAGREMIARENPVVKAAKIVRV